MSSDARRLPLTLDAADGNGPDGAVNALAGRRCACSDELPVCSPPPKAFTLRCFAWRSPDSAVRSLLLRPTLAFAESASRAASRSKSSLFKRPRRSSVGSGGIGQADSACSSGIEDSVCRDSAGSRASVATTCQRGKKCVSDRVATAASNGKCGSVPPSRSCDLARSLGTGIRVPFPRGGHTLGTIHARRTYVRIAWMRGS